MALSTGEIKTIEKSLGFWKAPPTDTFKSSANSFGYSGSSWRRPLAQVLDASKFGGALLITSACDGSAWEFSGPFTKGPKLQVPGGKYRGRSRQSYREQALLGVDIVTTALIEAGVPRDKIEHMDFCDDCDSSMDPIVMIPQFWHRYLNSNSPQGSKDALVYYCGPSVESGEWALGWVNQKGEDKVCLLDPESLLPEPGPKDGVPGTRFVVSDAPGTSRMWLRPSRRLRGLTAWEGEAMPGGPGGPPLTRWLAGMLGTTPPTGVQAFLELPPDAGLELLPCHKALFWGPSPPLTPVMSGHLLWELAEFVGAATVREQRAAATKEILLKGGPQILLMILAKQVGHGQQQLALQVLWLLQALASEAPVHRWAGTMNEALAAALALPDLLCWPGGVDASGNFPELLGAVLGFTGSAAARCPRCREEVSHGGTSKSWPAILKLVTIALSTTVEASALLVSDAIEQASSAVSSADTLAADNGAMPAMAASSAAARYACQVVSQAANHRPIGVSDHKELLAGLLAAFSAGVVGGAGQELSADAAEALLYATVRNNDCKLELLSQLQHGGQFNFVTALSQATNTKAVMKALSLVRSLASAQPNSAVQAGLSIGIVDAVVRCLSKDCKDPTIQRWGLAALGALCHADEMLAERAAEAGGPSCVVWALGADSLSKAGAVEQESLFCAYALLRSELGRDELVPKGKPCRLPGLTAAAISRGIRDEGGSSEAALWGLRIYERIAQTRARIIAPYVEVILDAMLIQGCLHRTMIAGANTVSHLAAVSEVANPKLVAMRVPLVKALQTMSHEAAAEKTEAGREREQELLDWVQVFIDILGPPRWPPVEDELPDPVEDDDEDNIKSQSTSKNGSKHGSKSRTGTKLDSGSQGGPSRSATKGGTKDPAASRTKSKAN